MTFPELRLASASPGDARALVALRNAVAERLTQDFGRGHWSSPTTERGVLRGIEGSRVLVAWSGEDLVGTLRLATKKPWAIDSRYFTAAARPLYLHDMAVDPARQRQGIGRRLLEEARGVAASWPADVIRLDAYDSPAGAGGFYARCGYREVGRVVYRRTPLKYFELRIDPVRVA